MQFCVLEKDDKTFAYLKQYGECFERGESCTSLDNLLQAEEIKRHLFLNGYPLNDQQEKLRWVTTYGKAFRDYINTIKLVYVVWKSSGHRWSDISFDEFKAIEERINSLKESCLDTLF